MCVGWGTMTRDDRLRSGDEARGTFLVEFEIIFGGESAVI